MSEAIEPAAFGAGGEVWRWRPGEAKFRLLAIIMLVLFAAYGAVYLATTGFGEQTHRFGDAFALWSWGRFAVEHAAATIYDPQTLHAAQQALGMDPRDDYPFVYPPSFLLVLWPLGILPYGAAMAALFAITVPLYLWATVGRRWRSPMMLAAVLAPTTTIAIVAGQTGFLAAAFLAGGIRVLGRRPLLGGFLLGLLTYKPQLGLLVPVALVAARQWRAIAAASATSILLALGTSLAFGAAAWPAWLDTMQHYAGIFAAQGSEITHLMPTVTAALTGVGMPPDIAQWVQAIAALGAALAVWRCFRDGPGPLAGAALLVATFLATPYAFVYDLPVVAAAVLWVIAARHDAGGTFGLGEMVVLMLAMLFPITMPAGNPHFPLSVVALALLLGMILRRVSHPSPALSRSTGGQVGSPAG